MLTTYVLIALLQSTPGYGGFYFPVSAEFNTLEACSDAANWLHDHARNVLAICQPKGPK